MPKISLLILVAYGWHNCTIECCSLHCQYIVTTISIPLFSFNSNSQFEMHSSNEVSVGLVCEEMLHNWSTLLSNVEIKSEITPELYITERNSERVKVTFIFSQFEFQTLFFYQFPFIDGYNHVMKWEHWSLTSIGPAFVGLQWAYMKT